MALSTRQMESSFPIRNIQIALQALAELHPAIVPPAPDGIYGPATSAAVMAFQQTLGLPPTGETDRATWDRLHTAYFELLRQRMDPEPVSVFPISGDAPQFVSGDDSIYVTQLMLLRIARHFSDFLPIEITGILDEDTIRELTRFQARALLPENGLLDRDTWGRLVRLYRMLNDSGKT